ncbi:MAG: superoxide dismutase family protein [Thermomicrobiales bacterium]|jgi:superoxide dismutase, Cu-Zn family
MSSSSGLHPFRRIAVGGALVTSLAFGFGNASLALAQDSTPAASPAAEATPTVVEPVQVTLTLIGVDNNVVGVARLTQEAPGAEVQITVANAENSGLTPGEHGLHIHEAGVCDPKTDPPFDSAGGHFNPENGVHGAPDDPNSHAGDLGNLTVKDDGSFLLQTTSTRISLYPGDKNSLADADGSSLLIHEHADDMHTDPSGESGGRIACGVIFQPEPGAAQSATPVASPEATPVG